MERERIDRAVHAQLDRRTNLLRDVARSGGKDSWSHLHSHGHRFPSVVSAVKSGYLKEFNAYHYEITEDGKRYLDDIETAKLKSL